MLLGTVIDLVFKLRDSVLVFGTSFIFSKVSYEKQPLLDITTFLFFF